MWARPRPSRGPDPIAVELGHLRRAEVVGDEHARLAPRRPLVAAGEPGHTRRPTSRRSAARARRYSSPSALVAAAAARRTASCHARAAGAPAATARLGRPDQPLVGEHQALGVEDARRRGRPRRRRASCARRRPTRRSAGSRRASAAGSPAGSARRAGRRRRPAPAVGAPAPPGRRDGARSPARALDRGRRLAPCRSRLGRADQRDDRGGGLGGARSARLHPHPVALERAERASAVRLRARRGPRRW